MILKSIVALTVALSLVTVSSVYAESGLHDVLDYDVGYDIENGEILAMDLDVDFTSLVVEVVSYDDGFVELNIPRGLLDATFDDEDDIFFVLIDGTESDYIEVDSNDSTRTIIIPFFMFDQEIEILGTEVLTSEPTTVEIPTWVKDNAGWWAQDLIGENDFVNGLEYLIQNNIISIPETESGEATGEPIPDWIKNNAKFWSDGLITDDDFVNGIQYLIQNGILQV